MDEGRRISQVLLRIQVNDMRHFVFKEADSYKVCFLVNQINIEEIKKEYLDYLDIDLSQILILDLYKEPKKKKTSVALMKEYLKEVKEVLLDYGVEYVAVCNGDYFKTFTKEQKLEVHLGYIKEVQGYKLSYVPDFKGIFYDPDRVREKIRRGLNAIKDSINGSYAEPGALQFTAKYPKDLNTIQKALESASKYPALTCDIETFHLKPHLAGIASIAFANAQDEGFSFKVDPDKGTRNEEVRSLLKEFFKGFKGTLIFHNISFDVTVLIYQLYMDDITDTKGCLEGINDLLKNYEDTKIIAYLATNSCAGNELGLKALAQEFAGNYAQEEISDVSKIPEEDLLEYNLIDCLSTWFVYNKYRPIMIKDNQLGIYTNLFIPALKDIIQMQLTGFPLNMGRVLEVEKILQKDMNDAIQAMLGSSLVQDFVHSLKKEWVVEKNKTLKKKQVTIEDAKVEFNPRSHKQLQDFLYTKLNLPVINTTVNGLPSTDAGTIKSLLNHTDDEEIKKILQALIDFVAVDKILTAFIPAFKEAAYSPKTDWHYLIGSFNLGGTVSGRLSSSSPNLQQIPATGSKYAKVIKSCFQAPEGWLLCGLDFNALEDHISALQTRDTNKLKVYLDHYDGHCLRAYSYFSDKMPDITQQLNEINKEGRIFKVTMDDGSVKYYNEFNPEFIHLKEQANAID